MWNKTVFSISHYLHHVFTSNLTEPCFFRMYFIFFRTRTFFSFRWSHNINFYSTDEPNQKLFNRPKHSGQLKSFNSIWTLFLAFSKHSNAFNSLSIYIFQFFFGLICCSRNEIPLATTCWTERFVYRYCSFSNLPRATRLYPFNIFFFIYFFSYIIITRDERKKTWQDTQQNWLNWISESYHIILFLSLIH